jgi:hypothetical protein
MSKYSSFKEHQLITESWRRYVNEGQEEQLADEAEKVLEKLSEDEIQDAISNAIKKGELPPEIQAQIEAVADKVATQAIARGKEDLDEAKEDRWRSGFSWSRNDEPPEYIEGNPSEVEGEHAVTDALAKLGGMAGFGAGVAAAPWLIEDAIGGLQQLGALTAPFSGGMIGVLGGIIVAQTILSARRKMVKSLSTTQVVEPVSGPDPE